MVAFIARTLGFFAETIFISLTVIYILREVIINRKKKEVSGVKVLKENAARYLVMLLAVSIVSGIITKLLFVWEIIDASDRYEASIGMYSLIFFLGTIICLLYIVSTDRKYTLQADILVSIIAAVIIGSPSIPELISSGGIIALLGPLFAFAFQIFLTFLVIRYIARREKLSQTLIYMALAMMVVSILSAL